MLVFLTPAITFSATQVRNVLNSTVIVENSTCLIPHWLECHVQIGRCKHAGCVLINLFRLIEEITHILHKLLYNLYPFLLDGLAISSAAAGQLSAQFTPFSKRKSSKNVYDMIRKARRSVLTSLNQTLLAL